MYLYSTYLRLSGRGAYLSLWLVSRLRFLHIRSEFDAAMATHLGPGVVGLAWWRELSVC